MVILNAKGIELLRRCHASVRQSQYPNFDILVVDCVSPDIAAFDPGAGSRTDVLHLEVDVGPAEQHNVGARRVGGDTPYIAFVDNDVEVHPLWLGQLVAALDSAPPQVACVVGSLYDTTRGLYVDDTILQFPGVQHARFAETVRPERRLLDFQTGAAFLVRRNVFHQLGGYDPSFFIYSDDSDFGWRLRLTGRDILMVPEASVVHRRSSTAGGNPRFRGLRVRNGVLSGIKNLAPLSLPLLAVNELLRLFGLLAGSVLDREVRRLLRQYLAGLGSIFRLDLGDLMERRRFVQRTRIRSDREVFARSPSEAARVLETGEVDLPMLKAFFLVSAILCRLLPPTRRQL